jgi:tagatose 6-phosphate kinase
MVLCVCPNPSIDTFIWLDSFDAGHSNSIKKEQQFPGGKGVHVALAIAELGEPAALLAFWGGPTGDWIMNECKKYGIACYGPRTEEWTRTCLTFKCQDAYNETQLLGKGPTISSKDFESFFDTFSELLSEADCVTMSGSWPVNAPENAYAQLINKAKLAGKKTFLDCSGEQLLNALVEKPHLVHINKTEAQQLFNEGDLEKMCLLLLEKCEHAAVSAGKDGLFLASGNAIIHAQCSVEEVYSTIGSGDCLLSGLALGYRQHLDIRETAKLGVACGAANCIRQDLGMLYNRDVEKLRQQAIIKSYKRYLSLNEY